MYTRIARQPIFGPDKELYGYELLYRDTPESTAAEIVNDDAATQNVLSDAITVFGISKLTKGHPAFINFTESLILEDFAFLADPDKIVIEMPQSFNISAELVEKLREHKRNGYTIALSGYNCDNDYEQVIDCVQIIKVDFLSTTPRQQEEAIKKNRGRDVIFVAEKLETRESYERARKLGYELFQGYFLERPLVISQRVPELSASSYGRIVNELQKPNVDFETCSKVIQSDAVLTYMFLRQVQTPNHYRTYTASDIKKGMVMMGASELRRWLFMVLMRQHTVAHSDELSRKAYLRGRFIERLMENCDDAPESTQGFLLGMFSLLDKILGTGMDELLSELSIDSELKSALLEKADNKYTTFLQFVMVYEMDNPRLLFPDIGLRLNESEVSSLYEQCVNETDAAFENIGGHVRC